MELKKLADIKMSKLLFEIGYVEFCSHFFWSDEKIITPANNSAYHSYINSSPIEDYSERGRKVFTIAVPYLTQVQNWLRNHHKIDIFVIGTDKGYSAVEGMNRYSKKIISSKKDYYSALKAAIKKTLLTLQ